MSSRRGLFSLIGALIVAGAVQAQAGAPCEVAHELPVVTHWSNEAQSFRYLASDQIDYALPYQADKPYTPGGVYPVYKVGGETYTPDLDHYVGTHYSTTRVPDARAAQWAQKVCADTGVAVKLLRPDALEGGRLSPKPGFVQALVGLIVKATADDPGSLAAVFLPPNWSADAAPGTYPILAQGYYDLNDSVFRTTGLGFDVARQIGRSGIGGRSGAIGVLWNGGGARATYTVNEKAYRQFGSVVDLIAQAFGGDRHRVMMFGGSRGGVSTINMASNPYDLDYTITFASASAAPAFPGSIARLSSTATYPRGIGNLTGVVGFHDSWRMGWRYPEVAGRAHLEGLDLAQSAAFVLTGSTDLGYADENLGPFADRNVERLERAGTELYLEIGTHDRLPYILQVEYAKKLIERGLPVHADVVVRGGHGGGRVNAEGSQVKNDRMWEALLEYIDPARSGKPRVEPGWTFYRVDRRNDQRELFEPEGHPFTLEAPYLAVAGQRFPLIFIGEPGTEYDLRITPPVGVEWPVARFRGAIPKNEPHRLSTIEWFATASGMPPGDYGYRMTIRKTGGKWIAIPETNTPAGEGERAILRIIAEEPNLPGAEWSNKILEMTPHLNDRGGNPYAWGLSEY